MEKWKSPGSLEPDDYETWYHTPHGRWIAEQETNLLQHFLDIPPGTTLLDVGCGTGHFSRRMAASGLHVVGLDKDGWLGNDHPHPHRYPTRQMGGTSVAMA